MDTLHFPQRMPYFLAVLFGYLCYWSEINAATLNSSNIAGEESKVVTSNGCLTTFKLDAVNNALKQIDGAVQNLEEKAHNWAIFRHHIDAWNDQMKALEHKLDLVKRTQDEQQAYGNKLTSLEFTLNHILSKVVYLSDSCHQRIGAVASAHAPATAASRKDSDELLYEHDELLAEVKHLLSGDKRLRNEMSTRLSNILRHVQNIENDNCRRAAPAAGANDTNKMAKLMLPVGGCNATQRHNHNLDQTLRTLEQQVSTLVNRSPTPKEIKQMHSLGKKNAQLLESISKLVSSADARLLEWHDEGLRSWQHCQAISGELETFTESSDLLLKRIELVVRDVHEKLSGRVCKHREPSEDAEGVVNAVADVEDDELAVEDYSKRAHNDSDEVADEKEVATSNESGHRNDASSEVEPEPETAEPHFEIVEFVQSNKIACDALIAPRVDGIYKFSVPELNAAGRDFNERFCAFATAGPAWTVIQNRGPYVEQENFNRSWADYRAGFGGLDKDFWFGNEFIHQLVDRDDYELRIELADFDDEYVWAEYLIFRVDSERYNYNLLIGGHSGSVPDAMHYHNEMDFSTFDRRNDKSVDACCACATGYGSGWWFDNCSEANLNGVYWSTPTGHNYVGIIWEKWRGDYSLQKARMMIRPKNWTVSSETDNAHNVNNELTEDP